MVTHRRGQQAPLCACREVAGWGPRDTRGKRDEDRGPFLVGGEIPLMQTGVECPSRRGPQPQGDGAGKKGVSVGDLA